MKEKIVIADDEKGLADSLSYAFAREGYEVFTAYDGKKALALIEAVHPQLALLDVTMPYLTGFEVLKQLDRQLDLGVILLTAKNELVDKVLGLEFGADDYITKPFDMREVLARTAVLRGETLELTLKEFDLLWIFASAPMRVFTREQLLEMVWDMAYEGGTS